jgi:hypothetical protein
MQKLLFPLFICAVFSASLANGQYIEHTKSNSMAVTLDSAAIAIPFGGGSYGSGIRFEYSLVPEFSLIFPVEYRFVGLGGFESSSKFEIVTVAIGGRLYFSHFFRTQNSLGGFFVEGDLGFGYAHESSGMPSPLDNKGTTFTLSGALGYSHAFDFGLIVAASLGLSGRAFTQPISIDNFIYPFPELGISIGWAF